MSVRIAPERLSSAMPRSCAQLAHGQVLDDALLHVVEAGVVRVEDLARELRVEPLLRELRPRHREQPVEVRADHRRLAGGVAHALEPAELALRLLAHVVGHAGVGDLRAVLVDDGGLVLAELLADRVHLLAQEVLALLLLRARLDVVADAAADLQLGQPLALQANGELEPLGDVERLQQLDLVREGQVGRVAGAVRERAGLGDRAEERADALVGVAELEDLLHDRAILGLELLHAAGAGMVVGPLVHVDAQPPERVGLRGAEDAAVQAVEDDGMAAARQPDALEHLGHRSDRARSRSRAGARAAPAPRRRRRRGASPSCAERRRCPPGVRAGTSSR